MWASILWCLLVVYALWPLYVFTMAMLRARVAGTTTLTAWLLALPLVIAAVMLDILLNFTVFALLTWDLPKRGEWTFSQRLERLVRQNGWRSRFAKWLAASLLDPYNFDDHPHIK